MGDSLNADWIVSVEPFSALIRVGGREVASSTVPKEDQGQLLKLLLKAVPSNSAFYQRQRGRLLRSGGVGEPTPEVAPTNGYELVWEAGCDGVGAGPSEPEFIYFEEAPVPIYSPPATYPEEARRQKIEGKVLLSVVIDRRGAVCKIKLIRGIDILDHAAVSAVSTWRYKPAQVNGQPVCVWIAVPIEFHP